MGSELKWLPITASPARPGEAPLRQKVVGADHRAVQQGRPEEEDGQPDAPEDGDEVSRPTRLLSIRPTRALHFTQLRMPMLLVTRSSLSNPAQNVGCKDLLDGQTTVRNSNRRCFVVELRECPSRRAGGNTAPIRILRRSRHNGSDPCHAIAEQLSRYAKRSVRPRPLRNFPRAPGCESRYAQTEWFWS